MKKLSKQAQKLSFLCQPSVYSMFPQVQCDVSSVLVQLPSCCVTARVTQACIQAYDHTLNPILKQIKGRLYWWQRLWHSVNPIARSVHHCMQSAELIQTLVMHSMLRWVKNHKQTNKQTPASLLLCCYCYRCQNYDIINTVQTRSIINVDLTLPMPAHGWTRSNSDI